MGPPRPWTQTDIQPMYRHSPVEQYWNEPPPEPSARCTWWLERIHAGWRPNKRWRALDYYSAAETYGVWIWEWLHVLSPLLSALRDAEDHDWRDRYFEGLTARRAAQAAKREGTVIG